MSRATVAKWVRRYRWQGVPGLEDRSSAPHRHPRRIPEELERAICAVGRSAGFGLHSIGWALGLARSTVYAVLRRFGLHRLDRLHRIQPPDRALRAPGPPGPPAPRREAAGAHPRGRRTSLGNSTAPSSVRAPLGRRSHFSARSSASSTPGVRRPTAASSGCRGPSLRSAGNRRSRVT
ncbi:MAG: hypothetical protein F4150_03940 [Chloroflexi bacterium]|nr:hypothetical protein [Chloroflexota bacterium]